MAGADEYERLREALLTAIATEHRLHEAAAAEQAAARRWEARVTLARRKEAADLAAMAQQRAGEHARRAHTYQAESLRQRAHITQLKTALLHPPPVPRRAIAVADGDAVGQRLDALDRESQLERDLAELKRQLGRQ
jgi:hypothetical protein